MNKPPASVAQYLGAIGAHKGNGVMSDAKRWAFFKPGIPEEVRQFLRESGAKGGAAGKGKPRGFATLTPTQRRELAKAAARQKWKDKRSADSEKNQAAVELGRLGGLAPREGPRGFAALPAAKRSKVAAAAARARWEKEKAS